LYFDIPLPLHFTGCSPAASHRSRLPAARSTMLEENENFGFSFLGSDGDGLVKLEMPDLPPDWFEVIPSDVEIMEPPAVLTGQQGGIWQALCERMMTDIHRNHTMSEEEKEASLRFVTLPIPGSPPGRILKLVEDPKGVISAGATGSVLWPACMAMIQELDEQFGHLDKKPKSAIELGAGLGALGLFLAVHQGIPTTITELPEVLPLLQRSVKECKSHQSFENAPVEVAPLRWGELTHIAPLGTFDLVVGSDISYRPDCLDELLQTAESLLSAEGRFLLSLQDRSGEEEKLEAACEKQKMRIVSKKEVKIHEQDVEYTEVANRDYCRGEDGLVKVFIYELSPEKRRKVTVTGSAEDVEAEFERLTGICPDQLLPKDFRSASTASEATGASYGLQSPKKDTVVEDMLSRGLGDYLCDMDEDLAHKISAMPPDQRPRTAKQKQAFAEAHYKGLPPPKESIPTRPLAQSGLNAEDDAVAAVASGGTRGRLQSNASRSDVDSNDIATTAASMQVESEDAATSVEAPKLGEAKLCVPGLEWVLTVEDDDKRLVATVSFGEDAWQKLQGSKANPSVFKEAVDFQLSESELHVLHHGTAVLQLAFPWQVNTTKATAKLCSKRRRVIIKAPRT